MVKAFLEVIFSVSSVGITLVGVILTNIVGEDGVSDPITLSVDGISLLFSVLSFCFDVDTVFSDLSDVSEDNLFAGVTVGRSLLTLLSSFVRTDDDGPGFAD